MNWGFYLAHLYLNLTPYFSSVYPIFMFFPLSKMLLCNADMVKDQNGDRFGHFLMEMPTLYVELKKAKGHSVMPSSLPGI